MHPFVRTQYFNEFVWILCEASQQDCIKFNFKIVSVKNASTVLVSVKTNQHCAHRPIFSPCFSSSETGVAYLLIRFLRYVSFLNPCLHDPSLSFFALIIFVVVFLFVCFCILYYVSQFSMKIWCFLSFSGHLY